MPIRPENRERYPTNWREISLAIRQRAGDRCECEGECGHGHPGRCEANQGCGHPVTGSVVRITVAHLDHTPENCDPQNLKAMCQRCHLGYDRAHHAATARATRERQRTAGMGSLFDEADLRDLVERREYSYCQAIYRDPTDDPLCVNGWRSRCEFFLVWTPSAPEARERALTYARQHLGEPHEVHVYPRNYVREARALLAAGQHELPPDHSQEAPR